MGICAPPSSRCISGDPVATYWLKYRGTRFPIRRGDTILGRSPYCSIVVGNRLVSRQHAALRLGPDGLTLEDLGSANGTTVNGESLSGVRAVRKGDVVRVGSEFLEVDEGDEPARHSTDTGQRSLEELDEPTTSNYRSSVELIEALVSGAAENDRRQQLVEAIRSAIELVLNANAGGRSLGDAERVRLLAAVEIVATWFPGGDLDAWRDDLRARCQG